jgi:hypothetical protein
MLKLFIAGLIFAVVFFIVSFLIIRGVENDEIDD